MTLKKSFSWFADTMVTKSKDYIDNGTYNLVELAILVSSIKSNTFKLPMYQSQDLVVSVTKDRKLSDQMITFGLLTLPTAHWCVLVPCSPNSCAPDAFISITDGRGSTAQHRALIVSKKWMNGMRTAEKTTKKYTNSDVTFLRTDAADLNTPWSWFVNRRRSLVRCTVYGLTPPMMWKQCISPLAKFVEGLPNTRV